ncbi:phenylacetate--CoA ligase family protein [Eubacterium xylanophilum]|uniref:phenylacetate--CoA ligase family protein n=1 Tax=Eubacterium xylanophilum TaxID=39497 RepID=UPI0004AF583C|nr:AMP-binding protein [Eubacterium xylanophilum]
MQLNQDQKRFFSECYNSIELYQDLSRNMRITEQNIEELWDDLPILDKTDIVNNQDRIIYPPAIAKNLNGTLHEVYTSGTTGECLQVTWSYGDARRSLSSLWAVRKQRFDIAPPERMCFFRASSRSCNSEKAIFEKVSETQIAIYKESVTLESSSRIHNLISSFSPVWMIVQPSIIQIIISAWKEKGLKPPKSIKYIECTGEMLSVPEKREIEDFFGCQVMDQYGTMEVNSIACSCECGKMHVMDSNVIVEVVDKHGKTHREGEGEICVTSLTNRSMPFIRYKTGDHGRLVSKTCSCGRRGSILELSYGRVNDKLIVDGREKYLYIV